MNHCEALGDFRDGDEVSAQADSVIQLLGVFLSQARCCNARGHCYHSQQPILYPSLGMGLFWEGAAPSSVLRNSRSVANDSFQSMDDTKPTELEKLDWYRAVGKGGKDMHPDACLAVRVETIIHLSFIVLCCQKPGT